MRIWIGTLIGVVMLLASAEAFDEAKAPAPPAKAKQSHIRISKETTHVTEPLDADGYVDYVEVLNREAAQGVTPENNFEVVVRQVIGPEAINEKIRGEYYRRLGLSSVAAKKGRYRTFEQFLDARLGGSAKTPEEEKKRSKILNALGDATFQPWTNKDAPLAGEWLNENSRYLDPIVEASKRPQSYAPYLGIPDAGSSRPAVIEIELPIIEERRHLARAICIRAMHRLADDDVEGARGDLQAMHRIARLTAQGVTVFERLVSVSMDILAYRADLVFLKSARVDSAALKKYARELQALQPLPSVAPVLDSYERFMYLDAVGTLDRSVSAAKPKASDTKVARLQAKLKAGGSVDWNEIMKWGNERYDQFVAAAQSNDPAEWHRVSNRISSEFDEELKAEKKLTNQLLRLAQGTALTTAVRVMLFADFMPAAAMICDARQSAEVWRIAVPVAFSLKAYQLDKGSYPDRLEALIPEYLQSIPMDPFGKQPLIYRKTPAGFELYSIGPNQKDDDGLDREASTKSDRFGDDVVVRLPLK